MLEEQPVFIRGLCQTLPCFAALIFRWASSAPAVLILKKAPGSPPAGQNCAIGRDRVAEPFRQEFLGPSLAQWLTMQPRYPKIKLAPNISGALTLLIFCAKRASLLGKDYPPGLANTRVRLVFAISRSLCKLLRRGVAVKRTTTALALFLPAL